MNKGENKPQAAEIRIPMGEAGREALRGYNCALALAPLHGHQLGRFFHGYYDCYCYLPLYVFCGEHLLAAKLRPSDIDGAQGALEVIQRIVGRIRAVWPDVQIVLRGDSGFCREPLMSWCESNGVDYLFGLDNVVWMWNTDGPQSGGRSSKAAGRGARHSISYVGSDRSTTGGIGR